MNTHGLQRHHATATKVAGIRHSLPVSIPARAMRPGRVVPRPLGQVLTMPSRHPATVVETAVVQRDHRIRLARWCPPEATLDGGKTTSLLLPSCGCSTDD